MVEAHDCQLQTWRSGPNAMHACDFALKDQQMSFMQKCMKQTGVPDDFTPKGNMRETCPYCTSLSVSAVHLPLFLSLFLLHASLSPHSCQARLLALRQLSWAHLSDSHHPFFAVMSC